MKFKILFLIALSPFTILSQNETSKWYFGQNAGLDFATTPPTALTNGVMNTLEGCASIADGTGNLLFYTDAVNIWNQQHVVMANGAGLLGNGVSFTNQAALIIKKPGSSSDYFIFTLGANGSPNGLRYSIVNMVLSAGMGSVTTKNILMQTPSSEKLTAVKHCNGTDIWLISHDTNAVFRCFLISATGLSSSPVISSFQTTGINYSLGGMKVSPGGNKIGLGLCYDNGITNFGGYELYDFDNSTGIVSNRIAITPVQIGDCAYSCEFSPDGSKLYGTFIDSIGGTLLLQWDLCANSSTGIASSQYTVSNSALVKNGIQLAMDGKIYVSKYNKTHLGVINYPNNAGSSCNYVDSSLTIQTGLLKLGLPNFVSSYFFAETPQPFVYAATQSCSTSFTPQACMGLPQINSLTWNFGDPQSGVLNSSTQNITTHHFASPGNYTVQLIRNYSCYSDTISQTVNVSYSTPTLNISGSTVFCVGDTRNLTVTGANAYTWSTNSNLALITITPLASGIFNYSVTGTSTLGSCSTTKAFSINVTKCTGISSEYKSGINIFPNPTSGSLFIETEKVVKIIVYNQLGEILLRGNLEAGNHKMDFEKLQSGIYYLDVYSDTNAIQHFKFLRDME